MKPETRRLGYVGKFYVSVCGGAGRVHCLVGGQVSNSMMMCNSFTWAGSLAKTCNHTQGARSPNLYLHPREHLRR